ncbi:N-sulphoglucosamine sulphohydrolase-like isoform X2 [Patiria miniata]|uniref:Sulfatase N-terminal domain-containing protein n=1 Tax=Patiria miniata TaxID=46514 RepID=A0A914AL40_PATMI|nr:N-sulphoglucosamine sulphohydrolase-like isoform X2 [Patiria miniata]
MFWKAHYIFCEEGRVIKPDKAQTQSGLDLTCTGTGLGKKHSRRSKMAMLVLGVVCLLLAHVSASPPKKNALVIIADDAGFETQVYNNSVCKTPNIDQLAQSSVVIRHAYTSVSSCSPSRSAILTGLPQHQNGMYGLEHTVHHFRSFDAVQTLPVILKPAGIKTAIIGKKHVAPAEVYKFDYEETEFNNPMLQCARNITRMKEFVQTFLSTNTTKPFMLYVGFNDPHRCGGKLGLFCDKWGTGAPGMGVIPDWHPLFYKPEEVVVPPYLPDTPATRMDIAAQYTSISRMDQGVGMLLKELQAFGHLNDTLIIYTADNGIPFPNAKTNLYEPGMGEPMMVSNPYVKQRWGQYSEAITSTTDIVPTVLDWFGVSYPDYVLEGKKVTLTGKSMLPITSAEPTGWDHIFSSHNFHEVTMYYPMRVMRDRQYRLIHNMNYRAPYPIAQDLAACPTFIDILNNTAAGKPTKWYKTLDQYYYRPEWELYDVTNDPLEKVNLAYDAAHKSTLEAMQTAVCDWRHATNDPWRCFPEGVIHGPKCIDLQNEPPKNKYAKEYNGN